MAKITWANLNTSKLNKALKIEREKPGTLAGPRASEGSYGELAQHLAERFKKPKKGDPERPREPTQKAPKTGGPKEPTPKGTKPFGGRRGVGIAVKGGGRIL